MFKKFANFFIEDEEDDNQEYISNKKKVIKPEEQIIYKKVDTNIPVEKIEQINNVEQKVVEKTNVLEKSIRIDVDDIEVKPVVVKKEMQKSTSTEKYIFNPPLSPIFGVIGDEKNTNELKAKTQANYSKAPSQIGTIISPIFGKDEDNELDNIINNVIDKNDKVNAKSHINDDRHQNFSIDELLRISMEEVNKEHIIEEEIDNITLFDKE